MDTSTLYLLLTVAVVIIGLMAAAAHKDLTKEPPGGIKETIGSGVPGERAVM